MKTLSLPSLWIVAAVLGVGAGIIGTALTFGYLHDYSSVLANFSGPINLTGERIVKAPQNLVEAVKIVKENVSPACVEIFTAPSDPVGIYESGQGQAGGFFITSDGWLVTAVSSTFLPKVGSTVVVFDNRVFPIKEAISDPAIDIWFLKIEATNLPVVSFGEPLKLSPGDSLFIVPSKDTFLSSTLVQSINIGAVSRSAETVGRRLILDQISESGKIGSAVANTSGEVVGVLISSSEDSTTVLPLTAIRSEIFPLLKEGKISNFLFGANVINIQEAVGYSETKTRGYRYGEIIESVLAGGPAASAGLQINDIILEVGGETLSGVFLAELLAEYHPGDTAILTIDRDGNEQEISVTLGSR